MTAIDPKTQMELEAAAYRRLVDHLRKRTDVQNIDMMNLAGFCRNCLSNWYQDAAKEKGLAVSKDEARLHVYGMTYDEWKAKYQKEASPEQKQAFAASKPAGPGQKTSSRSSMRYFRGPGPKRRRSSTTNQPPPDRPWAICRALAIQRGSACCQSGSVDAAGRSGRARPKRMSSLMGDRPAGPGRPPTTGAPARRRERQAACWQPACRRMRRAP